MAWIGLFLKSWNLFIGLTLVFIGQGLLYTLVTYRGKIEGFSTFELGLLMSFYFAGYLYGSWRGMRIIMSVGHVRVFGALTSAASVIFLLMFMFPDLFDKLGIGQEAGLTMPTYISWVILRFINGYAVAVILIVAESWLNDQSDNSTRGKNLSLYMMVSWGAPVIGQILLWYLPPESNTLFLLGSVFVSVAAVPMLLSAKSVPEFSFPDTVSLKRLYAISPVGLIGCVIAGFIHGNFFASSTLFSNSIYPGDQPFGATVAAIIIISGIVVIPISGTVSDIFDRRKVLLFVGCAGALLTLGGIVFFSTDKLSIYIWLAIIGTMVLPTYSLSVSHVNDWLSPKQMISASATLVLVYSVGMAIAPLLTGQLIQMFGSKAYFYFSMGLFVSLAVLCAYRISVSRKTIPTSDTQEGLTIVPTMTPLSSVFEEQHQAALAENEDDDTNQTAEAKQ